MHRHLLLSMFVYCLASATRAQELPVQDSIGRARDFQDVARSVLKKKKGNTKPAKQPGFALLPSFGYNPSFGFIIGAKGSISRQFDTSGNTRISFFGLEALYGTRNIITLKARHNIFTPGNKWNWQGDWQISRYGMVDYGIGTGTGIHSAGSFGINQYPVENGDSAFPIKYVYIRLLEKAYKNVAPHWYVGAGFGFDIFSHVRDEKMEEGFITPHQVYSLAKGFEQDKYSVNGFLIALQYNNTEHPIRPYGGFYADVTLRMNQEWLGSTRSSVQLQYDIRKYWSVSRRNPEQVLALWGWASFTLSGSLPYLAFPFTASDTYGRSGRGYTLGRFKGPSFAYFETEYRFPITRNKLIAGVCFMNFQTASDAMDQKVFESWEPAGGVGLRILFQKQTRSTLCIDYAKGRYGSSGLFFGLNEAF